jgi:hypothetical protein
LPPAAEQKAVNNPNLLRLVNPEDTRGEGEAASIARMIQTMVRRTGWMPPEFFSPACRRAAMAAAMAAYPEMSRAPSSAALPLPGAECRDVLERCAAPLRTAAMGRFRPRRFDHKGPGPKSPSGTAP